MDEPGVWSPGTLLWIAFFLLMNGYFVAIEFALVKVRQSRLEVLAEEGNAAARRVLEMIAELPRYLSAAQVGITLASLVLGWLGEPAMRALLWPLFQLLRLPEPLAGPLAIGAGFAVVTALHIVVGEQAPKVVAVHVAEQIALRSYGPLYYFYRVMRPFIALLDGATRLVVRLLGFDPGAGETAGHTEEELRLLVRESHESGLIDESEYDLVEGIFDFAETNAREIMVPRTEIECLYTGLSYEENMRIVREKLHTRYPLCDPDKDHIIGFIHIKDLWRHPEERDLKKLIRPITKVPESIPLVRLLKIMQKEKTQMTILIDEYGGTAGLVTLEDVLEEIVGEIQDEFDEERPEVEEAEGGAYSVDGRMLIEEFNERFGTAIHDDDYDTIGGWAYAHFDTPPSVGARFVFEGAHEFVIAEMDGLRVARLLYRRTPEAEAEKGPEEEGVAEEPRRAEAQ
ncbi:hemolysin family protein [Hydrogenibacillus schlegelii]|uniref:hemolysin family protein n=1 Tax=Hydrogenibacillus schlegelii TaxID=1484 RepID=UPI0009EA83F7|nr:hemolysin family protein [Hydrogenibacillus schlegelii]